MTTHSATVGSAAPACRRCAVKRGDIIRALSPGPRSSHLGGETSRAGGLVEEPPDVLDVVVRKRLKSRGVTLTCRCELAFESRGVRMVAAAFVGRAEVLGHLGQALADAAG